MGFSKLETVQKFTKTRLASISYRRPHARIRGQNVRPQLKIGLPKYIVEDSGLKGGERVALFIGEGKDSGKAQLRRDDGGGKFNLGQHGGGFFQLGFCPFLGSDAADAEQCAVTRTGSGDSVVFEIVLPAWFKEEET